MNKKGSDFSSGRFKRIVGDGEVVPFGYGFGWRLYHMRASVAYPVPFNLLLRWLRSFWFVLSRAYPEREDKARREGYYEGFEAAKNHWYENGKRDGRTDFSRELGEAILAQREYFAPKKETTQRITPPGGAKREN